jgi:hypothetical protein
MATITLKIVPFRSYAPFQELLPLFKCILEVSSVRYSPPAILPRLPQLCQNGGLSIGETKKNQRDQVRGVGWVEDDSHIVFGQFLGEKRIMIWCVVEMQQPVLLTPKFRAKYSYIFTQLS